MKLKTVEIEGKTYAVVENDMPVYDDNGSNVPFDAPRALGKITDLQGESKGHRVAKEEAQAKLKKFEGIDDPEAALRAMEKVKGLNEKDLIDAGKVEEIKAKAKEEAKAAMDAAIKAKDEEIDAIKSDRDKLSGHLNNELIGGNFSRSKYVQDNIAIPNDLLRNTFERNFEVVDGQVVAKDAQGNRIYSKKNPGDAAGFDEAIEMLVEGYQHKDQILKGRNQNGSNAPGGGGGGAGRSISGEDFNAMSPKDRAKAMAEGATLT